jgi:hypothetical protein
MPQQIGGLSRPRTTDTLAHYQPRRSATPNTYMASEVNGRTANGGRSSPPEAF